MRKILLIATAAIVLISTVAFKSIQHYADILKELKMEHEEANESIFVNFQEGTLDFPYSTLVTRFALGRREAAVKELGDYIKAYTSSAAFAAKYKAAREEMKPKGDPAIDEKIANRIELLADDAQKTTKEMEKASGTKKELYYHTLEGINKELIALSQPGDPNHQYYVNKLLKKKSSPDNTDSESLKEWQEQYPPSVKEMVRKRLTEFLELTKDIDFNAKLISRDGKMVFADPKLEEKDYNWKKCFRCGKETITAARNYAKQWLASLN